MGKPDKRRPESSAKDNSNKRAKHGRPVMRNVTRTARRPPTNRDEPKVEAVPDFSEGESDESQDEETPGISRDQAYGALLTLLKSDHPSKKSKTKKVDKDTHVEEDKEPNEEEQNDDEVAGVNINEDDGEDEEDDDLLSDDDDEEEAKLTNDPFEVHYNLPQERYIDQQQKLVSEKWSLLESKTLESGYSYLTHVPPGTPLSTSSNPMKYVKNRLKITNDYPTTFSDMDKIISNAMFNYRDINYAYKYYLNTSYRKLYVIHALNHIFKTRDRIIKNTTKLHHIQEQIKLGKNVEEVELRDQGFTRPKVLILLPTRNACYETVELLIKLSGSEQQENKKKFMTQFYSKDIPPDNKPNDFKDAFKGNNTDFFCMGMKFTRKSVKLYSSFYSSDIIIASPIGLSMILENQDKKKRQYDFISSIEVLIMDRANQIENQNWDHINTVLKYVNKIPKEFHDADFSRIRMWSINEQAKLFRQTLIFSEYQTPNINNITTKSQNLSGRIKVKPVFTENNCIMNSIGLKISQIFHRFDSESPMSDPESRFKFFTNTILPSLMKSTSYEDGILIFIPSYYDYLRIKNHMASNTKHIFAGIDEYTSQSKLDRIRTQFVSGKIKILLYTERLHYFRRYELNGVKSLFMYGLPSNPLFYKEFIRFIGKSVFKQLVDIDLAVVKIMYSKWDMVSLERIVGNQRAPVLCNSRNEVYEFR
jgi:U3 small nucleolar RNA-associated protein 25